MRLVTRMTDLTMGLIKVKIEQPVTSALLNETSVCKTVFCVFLKTLIINMSYTDIGRHINKLINVS